MLQVARVRVLCKDDIRLTRLRTGPTLWHRVLRLEVLPRKINYNFASAEYNVEENRQQTK
jgi:hypothetical protein